SEWMYSRRFSHVAIALPSLRSFASDLREQVVEVLARDLVDRDGRTVGECQVHALDAAALDDVDDLLDDGADQAPDLRRELNAHADRLEIDAPGRTEVLGVLDLVDRLNRGDQLVLLLLAQIERQLDCQRIAHHCVPFWSGKPTRYQLRRKPGRTPATVSSASCSASAGAP